MDWTFWLGIVVIAALWIGSQWLFSERRFARRKFAEDPRQAVAIDEAETERRETRFWLG